eukprot:2976072-Amphidinium_carterae.1
MIHSKRGSVCARTSTCCGYPFDKSDKARVVLFQVWVNLCIEGVMGVAVFWNTVDFYALSWNREHGGLLCSDSPLAQQKSCMAGHPPQV